jgi:hypothetical protein
MAGTGPAKTKSQTIGGHGVRTPLPTLRSIVEAGGAINVYVTALPPL